MTAESPPSFSPARRWRIALNVLVASAALLGIVALVNILAARHFKQFDLGGDARHALSPMTLRLLQAVTNQVKVIVFFDRGAPLYDEVARLLSQYQSKCRSLEVELVDPVRARARAEQVLAAYNQKVAEKIDNRVIFTAANRVKAVYESELSEYENAANELLAGQEIKRTGFRGEQLFTAALFSVMEASPMRACFVRGHGEHEPSGQDYSEFARVLAESNMRPDSISLLDRDVPQDCHLLIIAGAKEPLARLELERIDQFLNQGGRLLVLFNYHALDPVQGERSGLDRLLLKWGVEAGQNFISDGIDATTRAAQGLIVQEFGSHPTVNTLQRSRLMLVLPRSVRARSSGGASSGTEAPKVAELLWSSPDAVAIREMGGREGAGFRSEALGRKLPVAVAVEKGGLSGLGADRKTTRLVVVGDSLFLGDSVIDQGANRDFARNAVNWLLNQELLLEGIGPRAIQEYKVVMTATELRMTRWMMLGVLPGSMLALGWMVWLRRRS